MSTTIHFVPAGSGLSKWAKYFAVVCIVLASLGFIAWCIMHSMHDASPSTAPVTTAASTAAAVPAPAITGTALPSGCPAFSVGGAMCAINATGVWIWIDSNARGVLYACWSPRMTSGAFKKIEYITDSNPIPQSYDPDGPAPKKVVAYHFVPNLQQGQTSLMLQYNLAAQGCLSDSAPDTNQPPAEPLSLSQPSNP